jgi:hypothetical protein
MILISVAAAGCGEKAPPPKVAVENKLFRILDVNVPAHATLQHSFSNGAALVVMTDGARMRMRPPGKDWGEETVSSIGSVTVAEPGEYGIENVGDGALQLLALENLSAGGGSTAAPLAGKGSTSVGESASLRAYDAQLTNTQTQVSHVHAAPAVAILIRGKVLSQGPENKDKSIGDLVSGLKQLDTPGQWLFVPAGEAHYLVRLGVDRTQIVEVELR